MGTLAWIADEAGSMEFYSILQFIWILGLIANISVLLLKIATNLWH